MSEKQADKATMFASLRASLSRSVRRIVPDKEIEDVVQETFLRFCQASDEQEIRSPEAFMFRTARNLALDHVKSAEYRLTETLEDYSDFLAPTHDVCLITNAESACAHAHLPAVDTICVQGF